MHTIVHSVGKNGVNQSNDVKIVQMLINENIARLVPLAPLKVDGRIGPKTIGAIEEFQRRVVKLSNVDGRVDPNGRTLRELNGGSGASRPAPGNMVAQFEETSRSGQTRQMVSGRITVNNRTYSFRSGGHGRGNLPPGSYTVTPHLWERSETGFSVDGVGYSFALSDAFDSRVGDTRTLLRIHPDGGVAGTNGCIGIVGNGATQRAFREDMRAELNRGNNRSTLNVRR